MSSINLQAKWLESDIKAIVLEHMRAKNLISDRDVIINEFTVDDYSRRADIVIVRDYDVIAVEVKSEFDTLARLKGQTEKYSQFFDKVIVAATSNHIPKATTQTHSSVELWEVTDNGVAIKRRGKKSPVKDKSILFKMMTLRELSTVATKHGFSEKKRTRTNLECFLQSKSVRLLREEAINCLRKRYAMTSNYFWKNISNKPISANSLQALSFASVQKAAQQNSSTTWLSNISLDLDALTFKHESID